MKKSKYLILFLIVTILFLFLSCDTFSRAINLKNQQGASIKDEKLDLDMGFDAIVYYKINIVDITKVANGGVILNLRLSENQMQNDPKYKQILISLGPLGAKSHYQAECKAIGSWIKDSDRHEFNGSCVYEVKSGEYNRNEVIINYYVSAKNYGYFLINLPNNLIKIPSGTLCYLGRITIYISKGNKTEFFVQNDLECIKKDLESFKIEHPGLYEQYSNKIVVLQL